MIGITHSQEETTCAKKNVEYINEYFRTKPIDSGDEKMGVPNDRRAL